MVLIQEGIFQSYKFDFFSLAIAFICIAHCTHIPLPVSALFLCPGAGGEMPGRSQVEGCDVLVPDTLSAVCPVHPVCSQDSPSIIVNT